MKTIIITGALGEIGQVVVENFRKEEYQIALLDHGKCEGVDLPDRYYKLDITDEEQVRRTVDCVVQDMNGIDALVNVAGIGEPSQKMVEKDSAQFRKVMEVNFMGTYYMMKYVIPYMRTHKKGSIVNFSSIAGVKALPGIAAYSASKWAVTGLSQSAVAEYYEDNIRINVVCPGSVQTKMNTTYYNGKIPADEAERAKRRAKPQDIADVVSFLISDKARHVNGIEMVIDGGRRYL